MGTYQLLNLIKACNIGKGKTRLKQAKKKGLSGEIKQDKTYN